MRIISVGHKVGQSFPLFKNKAQKSERKQVAALKDSGPSAFFVLQQNSSNQ